MKPTVLLFVSLLWAGSCDKADEPGYMPGADAVFMSIAHLKSLCTKASVTLTRDIRLRCVVTANDHYGEFDRTLVVADASGGIEVAVDAADLYRDYPLGANLTLYCNGLALGDYGGKIQLGAPPGATMPSTASPRGSSPATCGATTAERCNATSSAAPSPRFRCATSTPTSASTRCASPRRAPGATSTR